MKSSQPVITTQAQYSHGGNSVSVYLWHCTRGSPGAPSCTSVGAPVPHPLRAGTSLSVAPVCPLAQPMPSLAGFDLGKRPLGWHCPPRRSSQRNGGMEKDLVVEGLLVEKTECQEGGGSAAAMSGGAVWSVRRAQVCLLESSLRWRGRRSQLGSYCRFYPARADGLIQGEPWFPVVWGELYQWCQ